MLQLSNVRKSYTTGNFTQVALDGVSIAFRDSEFAAILGTSGSGKTTMLNIIGGLDHYDSGDLLIDGISTKQYSDRDWDAYRNHRVGFIFQSYNLIPHQSILSNVELALTLSGVTRAERRERAIEALEHVGLGEHIHKRPNQLSGGQMQRVAIARALVNDPTIVLADEPTGALDTETGIQVMNILKEIASDRLVVMVTHNPELARDYATRIVNLKDGRVIGDNNPFDPNCEAERTQTFGSEATSGATTSLEAMAAPKTSSRAKAKKDSKVSMSFLTALSLSFNNLMAKKGRTFLTAFAGSIGIIGIASILALSNGVNNYIADTEEEALTSYPLTINKSSFDMTSMFTATADYHKVDDSASNGSDENSPIPMSTIMGDMFAQVKNNDLVAFKKFLDSPESGIDEYVNTIQYNYGIEPQVFMTDTENNGVEQLNPTPMKSVFANGLNSSSIMPVSSSMNSFTEMLDNRDILESQMDVVEGRWPESYDEAVLVLSRSGQISDYTLYSLGVLDPSVMNKMVQDALAGKEAVAPEVDCDFTYSDALGLTFKVVPKSNFYQYNAEQNAWTDMSKDTEYMTDQINNGIDLKIVGIVKPSETATSAALNEGVAYTPALTKKLIEEAEDSEIVKSQLNDSSRDVFTGKSFEELQGDQSNSFDMESMFTVDEDALSRAFSFDTSALSGSNMNIDLSGVDMSSAQIDPSQVQIDPSAMNAAFSEDSMRQVMAGAPKFEDWLATQMVDGELPAEQKDAINQLASGFTAWLMKNPTLIGPDADFTELFQQYIASDPTAAAALGKLNQSYQDLVNRYMTEAFAPYISNAMQQMMAQAAQAMANQMATQMATQMALATNSMGSSLSQAISGQLSSQMASISSAMQNGFSFDADAFASAIQFNMTQEDLTSLLSNYMNSEDLTYDNNLVKLGYANEDSPQSVSIYPKDFPAKEAVIDIIDDYNEQQTESGNEDSAIEYTDFVGALMSSVTNIVDTISLVLIAFVGISLVVSSIMIAIITYISVLERKKEIGILRAMGASKHNIGNVFNAETVIEGLIAGVFAILVVYIASVPVNAFVLEGWKVPNVMSLPASSALVLIAISVILTFVAGLIPSSMASRRDPVEALRSE